MSLWFMDVYGIYNELVTGANLNQRSHLVAGGLTYVTTIDISGDVNFNPPDPFINFHHGSYSAIVESILRYYVYIYI